MTKAKAAKKPLVRPGINLAKCEMDSDVVYANCKMTKIHSPTFETGKRIRVIFSDTNSGDIAYISHQWDEAETEVWARMLSAAPDLYRACRHLLAGNQEEALNWARHAVAKAETFSPEGRR